VRRVAVFNMQRGLSREERKIQAEMEMFKKMEDSKGTIPVVPRPKTPRDKPKSEEPESKRRRIEEEPCIEPPSLTQPESRPAVVPEVAAPPKKPGVKGKFGKKAWLKEFQETAAEEPVPAPEKAAVPAVPAAGEEAPVVNLCASEDKKGSIKGNLKKRWAQTWGDDSNGIGAVKMSDEQISRAQDIESMEAQLKKLQEKRSEQDACAAVPSSTTGTAGETKETRQLTPLEEQQKRLAEAEERVRKMQQQARERAEMEAKQAAAQTAAVVDPGQAPAQLIAEAEQRVMRLQRQQQEQQRQQQAAAAAQQQGDAQLGASHLQEHPAAAIMSQHVAAPKLAIPLPSPRLTYPTGHGVSQPLVQGSWQMAQQPVTPQQPVANDNAEPEISYSPPDSWSDDERKPNAAVAAVAAPAQGQAAISGLPAGNAEPVMAATVEELGLAGSKFTCALAEIVYMRRQHLTLFPTCSANEMLHRLDDVRAESEHRMPGRYIAPQQGGFSSMRGHENNMSRRDISTRQAHPGQDNPSFMNRH